jgi:ring-1,2-phenylacetyl-CoA epoxidase subunit PaaE
MAMQEAGAAPASVVRIPDPAEPVPAISVPALGLLLGGLALWWGSTAAYIAGVWPWPVTTVLNTVASYLLFTVSHDASHHSLSRSEGANTWIGRVATAFFAPHAGFRTWRFIQMQHHRFTNHHGGNDPDAYTNRGPAWQRPLRWLTIDLWYMFFYLPRVRERPSGERRELLVTWVVIFGASVAAIATGHLFGLIVVYYLPIRLAILFLGWAFDYLPHHGLRHTPEEDRFKTTRNRVGAERLLSPLLLYQNYHLVHHLHPLVPFHRYVAVWLRNEDAYLARDPTLSTVRGRPLTAAEYRRLRELAEHH